MFVLYFLQYMNLHYTYKQKYWEIYVNYMS